jgi:predicted pyridoxine 5'-phosphate oxidase superfamily flavin-nucleotide-binding protein
MSMYHEGMRALQDRYGGRKVADRLEEHRKHVTFNEEDKAFIESAPFFFLATTWKDSVDCSMKGGLPGFVRVTAANELTWPDYDGNRMYRSLGNIAKNPRVGMLFVRFDARSTRLRLTGNARIDEEAPDLADWPGARRLVRMVADYIYYNCPRNVPKMTYDEPSIYSPRADYTPPEPEWKSRDYIRDVIEE